jgi:hypothetical protein
LLGASYGFHVTLTCHVLKNTQSDITEQGYLFSAVVIFLGNVCILLLAVPMLGEQVKPFAGLQWWAGSTLEVVRWLGRLH